MKGVAIPLLFLASSIIFFLVTKQTKEKSEELVKVNNSLRETVEVNKVKQRFKVNEYTYTYFDTTFKIILPGDTIYWKARIAIPQIINQ